MLVWLYFFLDFFIIMTIFTTYLAVKLHSSDCISTLQDFFYSFVGFSSTSFFLAWQCQVDTRLCRWLKQNLQSIGLSACHLFHTFIHTYIYLLSYSPTQKNKEKYWISISNCTSFLTVTSTDAWNADCSSSSIS